MGTTSRVTLSNLQTLDLPDDDLIAVLQSEVRRFSKLSGLSLNYNRF